MSRKMKESTYPREAVLSCQNSRNQICRKKKNVIQRLGGGPKAANGNAPTLLETENPEPFRFYDVFEVQEFNFSNQEAAGHLKIQISLLEQYKELQISAQILDLDRESVIAEIRPKTAKDTNKLVVEEDFFVAPADGPLRLGVIAYGDWGNLLPDENELTVFRKANSADADYVYKHIYPKKEASTVILGKLEGILPDRYTKGSRNHIVIALIRKPADLKDVDYLCGFGRDGRTGHPILCVPGKGDLNFSVEEIPKTDAQHKNSAVCKLYRKEGGAAVIAGTEDYGCDQSLHITSMAHGYHYEFVSWKVGYDDPAGWEKMEFDYELEMVVYTVSVLNGTEEWHPHYLKVSSMSSGTNFTKEILPLQIMYGCVAPWTKIRMAGGEQRAISEVRIGDTVLGKGNRLMRVVNVWCGPENEKMLEIHGEGLQGAGLLLTKNHPVWVRNEDGSEGFKRAGTCCKGDRILVRKEGCLREEWIRIEKLVEKEPCEIVYNLDLEPLDESGAVGAGSMFCEDILTGDNQVQNGFGR